MQFHGVGTHRNMRDTRSSSIVVALLATCIFVTRLQPADAKLVIPPGEAIYPFTKCVLGSYSKKYLCDKSPEMSSEILEEIASFDNSTLCPVLNSRPLLVMGDSVMVQLVDVTRCLCPEFQSKVIITKGVDVQRVFHQKAGCRRNYLQN
jgi:hypothetical protein